MRWRIFKEKCMERKKENYLYKISLATQIGKKSGKLFLSVIENKIDGFLEVLGRKQPFCGEKTASGCVIRGQLKTLVSVFDYTATGFFDDKSISLDLTYKHGVFRLTGNCEKYTTE